MRAQDDSMTALSNASSRPSVASTLAAARSAAARTSPSRSTRSEVSTARFGLAKPLSWSGPSTATDKSRPPNHGTPRVLQILDGGHR